MKPIEHEGEQFFIRLGL